MRKNIAALMSLVFILMLVLGDLGSVAAQSEKTEASPEAILVSDDFESYPVGSTFPTAPWTNHTSGASWTVVSDGTNAARQSLAITNIISTGNTVWTNYKVSANVKANVLGIRSGIVARYTSSSAYYSLYVRTTTGGSKILELNKRTAAGNSVLQSLTIPLNIGQFYKLTLETEGSNIKAYLDDVLKLQAADSDYAAGKPALYNTGDTTYDDFVVEDFSTVPPAPAGLTAVAGNAQITLNWTSSTGAAAYNVKRSTTDGGPYETIASASSNTYIDTNVTFGTTYYYVVSAVNLAGESSNSAQASATAHLDPPAAPTALHTASGNQEAKIYWTAPFSATSYNVKRSPTSGGTYTTIAENVATAEYTDSGLTNGTTYYYKVSAENAAGESPLSSAVGATPRLGQIVNVSSQPELTTALNNAVAGDEIILTDGNYSAFKVRRKYGTAANPIIVRSQNPLGATFNAGQLELQNTIYMTFEGFAWTLSTSIKLRGTQHNRLTHNSFEFNETGITDLDWVSIGGAESHHNRIDHNDFKNKVTLGNYITISGENGQVSQYDLIDHNYFFNLGPRVDNEKETIRMGDSSVSQSSGFTVVEHNLFEQCDGDPEIVSVKTNDNIVRYNTFRRSMGGLTARQGNRSALYGNFFIGENVEGTGGIRAYGNDHKIYNNYFEGLTGTANYAPIAITNGDADGAELPGADQSKHYRPQRIMVANNTLVGNVSNIELGGGYTLPPRDITFANNIIVGSTGELVKYRTAPINPVYAGNIAYPTGTATIGITVTEAEIRNIDPLLTVENGLQKLGAGSPAIDASAINHDYVIEDFEGQIRDVLRDIGADEFGDFDPLRLPLSSVNAGLNSINYSISGRVVNPAGQGIGGVKVVLTNSAQARLLGTTMAETQSDAGGYFNITDVVPNESYILTLSKAQYSFDPDSISITGLSSDINLNSNGTLAPTAANAQVAGRVLNGNLPIGRAHVTITNPSGEAIASITNSFGYFSFDSVGAGQTYVLSVRSKHHQFESHLITVNDDLTDLIIQALPQ